MELFFFLQKKQEKKCFFYFSEFDPLFGNSNVTKGRLRELIRNDGIEPGLRIILWKIFLNYVPPDPSLWAECLDAKRKQFEMYITNTDTEE